eukprot:Pgem_evm1s14792
MTFLTIEYRSNNFKFIGAWENEIIALVARILQSSPPKNNEIKNPGKSFVATDHLSLTILMEIGKFGISLAQCSLIDQYNWDLLFQADKKGFF